MTKKYRLKSDQMGLKAGSIFEEDHPCEFANFVPVKRGEGLVPNITITGWHIEAHPELFELVIERWKPKGDDPMYSLHVDSDSICVRNGYYASGSIKLGDFRLSMQAQEAMRRVVEVLEKYHEEIGE